MGSSATRARFQTIQTCDAFLQENERLCSSAKTKKKKVSHEGWMRVGGFIGLSYEINCACGLMKCNRARWRGFPCGQKCMATNRRKRDGRKTRKRLQGRTVSFKFGSTLMNSILFNLGRKAAGKWENKCVFKKKKKNGYKDTERRMEELKLVRGQHLENCQRRSAAERVVWLITLVSG